MQSLLATVGFGERDIGLRLRLVALLGLQSRRQRRLVDVAQGRKIVVGNPLPQPHLPGKQDGLPVDHRYNRLHIECGFHLNHVHHDADIPLTLAQRHEYTAAFPYHCLRVSGNGIGEKPVQGQRKYDLDIFHVLAKLLKKQD